jgi:hypothetical protein
MRKSHIQGQGLMTGTSCLADLGKMAQEESESGPGKTFIEEEGKRLAQAQGSLMGVELGWSLSGSMGNFAKGQGCYWD